MSTTTTTKLTEAQKAIRTAVTADLIAAMTRGAHREFAANVARERLARGVKKVNAEALTRAVEAFDAGESIPQRATTVKALKRRSPRAAVSPEALPEVEGVWDENDMLIA